MYGTIKPRPGKENDPFWIKFCENRNAEARILNELGPIRFQPIENPFKVDNRSWLAKVLNL